MKTPRAFFLAFLFAFIPLAVGAALPGATTSIAPMLEAVTPAVVNIAVLTRTPNENPLLNDPYFRRFFNLPDTPPDRYSLSAGSGVIVDARNGFVVTNNHVIAQAQEVVVTLKDRRQFRARLVGADPATDIAVLKIDTDNLIALPLGDSDRLRVGDFVVAIGNPFGLGQTVTSGIISALGRTGLNIEGYEDFIQTDASINPGNSGGALVSFDGQLIGINTAIIGPAGGNVGIGFAVPVNMAKAVLDQLIRYGEVRRGRLGVAVQDLTADLAQTLQVAGNIGNGGAVIAGVEPGSSAERAGMRVGDVVVAVNGHPVRGAADLRNRIGLTPIGQDVRLDLVRGGQHRTVSAGVADTKSR
ncbi:MAG TPA: trypsin-like peptidase domain-containing protein [Azospirillaceae bacterium]|nr:trypsin-like peptidase domain-containing protein [Azospirillaceae bacterium]